MIQCPSYCSATKSTEIDLLFVRHKEVFFMLEEWSAMHTNSTSLPWNARELWWELDPFHPGETLRDVSLSIPSRRQRCRFARKPPAEQPTGRRRDRRVAPLRSRQKWR